MWSCYRSNNGCLLQHSCVPGTVASALHVLSHVILKAIQLLLLLLIKPQFIDGKLRIREMKKFGDTCVLRRFSHQTLCDPRDSLRPRLLSPWGFSRQEHGSGLPYPLPGDLSNPQIIRNRAEIPNHLILIPKSMLLTSRLYCLGL